MVVPVHESVDADLRGAWGLRGPSWLVTGTRWNAVYCRVLPEVTKSRVLDQHSAAGPKIFSTCTHEF
jgi:hypothetical protein